MAILASFMACTDLHNTMSLFGHHTNTFMSFLFGSRASMIMRRQLRIISVDLTSLLRFVMKSISFPISSLLFYFTSKVLLPVVIFGLVFSRPTLSNPDNYLRLSSNPNKPAGLRLNSKRATLCGRSRCMFSSLNSVNTFDQHFLEFNHDFITKNHAIQSAFRQMHPTFPRFPSRFAPKLPSLNLVPTSMPPVHLPSVFHGLRKVLSSDGVLTSGTYVASNESQLIIEVDHDGVDKIMSRLDEKLLPSSFLTYSAVAALDNCVNIHIIIDKTLFLNGLRQCSPSDGVNTATGSNSPQGIDTATMRWRHSDGTIHEAVLHDALHYPDSPVNVVSVTKLAQNPKTPKPQNP